MDGKIFMFDLQRFDDVCQIGETKYESLREAINAAADGDTITLLKDDTVSFSGAKNENDDKKTLVIDKNITIDGGTGNDGKGYKIQGTTWLGWGGDVYSLSDVTESNVHGFYIKSGNVTFKNVELTKFADGGTCSKFGNVPIITATDYTGKLTLDTVNINNFNRQAVCIAGGTFEVKDCTIDCVATEAPGYKGKDDTQASHFDYLKKGIEVTGAATGTIEGTTITNFSSNAGTGGDKIIYSVGGIEITSTNNVTVKDCTLTGGTPAVTDMKGETFGILNGGNATVTISNNTINADVSLDLSGSGVIEGDYLVLDDICYVGKAYTENETLTNVKETNASRKLILNGIERYYSDDTKFENARNSAVAQIGDKLYSSLSSAIAAATASDTITLNQDINLVSYLSVSRKITIDLNGKNITRTGKNNPFVLGNGADLTITDSSSTKGTISADNNIIHFDEAGAKFTLLDGNINAINAEGVAIYFKKSGSAEIKGGTITTNKIVSGNGTTTITGGVFSDDPSEYVAEDTEYQFLDDKAYVGASTAEMTATPYSLHIDGVLHYYSTETLLNAAKAADTNVASIGENNYYTTFDGALTAATAGDTIKLLQAVEDTDGIAIDKTLTIDLNDKTLTGSVTVNNNLTVTDSGTDATNGSVTGTVTVSAGGTFNMTGGTVTDTVTNNGTLNMNGGKIDNSSGRGVANYSTFNMNGGSIFGTIGIKMLKGVLRILGGKVHGRKAPSQTNVAENDGVVEYAETEDSTGGVGIDVAPTGNTSVTVGSKDTKSDIEISGEESALAVNAKDSSAPSGTTSTIELLDGKYSSERGDSITYNSTDTTLTLDGAILESKVTIGENASSATVGESGNNIVVTSVAMKSGTASSSSDSFKAKIDTSTSQKLDGEQYNFVSGGSVSDFAAVTVSYTTNANVLEDPVEYADAAEVAGNYTTLKQAIEAINGEQTADATITLLKDLTVSEQIEVTKSMSIDFGNYTITNSVGDKIAPLKVSGNSTTLTLSKNGIVDGGVEIADSGSVSLSSGDYEVVRIVQGDTVTVFNSLDAAMSKLDGGKTLFYNEETSNVGTISYTNSSDSKKSFAFGGIGNSKGISIGGGFDNISLTAANFENATITNGGGYTFNLSGESTANKTFTGSNSADKIKNVINKLTITGGTGDDSITNTAAQTSIAGGAGADTVINGGQSATILGGEGNDNISNSGASSTVDAGAGNDVISNSGASSSLFGGAGNDVISNTGTSTGTLWGGAGNDSLKGGNGADTFVYSAGADSINGFGTGDLVSLSGLTVSTDGSKLSSIDGGFTFTFSNANKLTFESPVESGVSLKSGTDDTYIYKATSIALGKSVTLGKDYDTATAFAMGTSFNSVNASALTKGIGITDNAQANYIIGGTGADTFSYSGGKDTIEGYSTVDVVKIADSFTPDPATSFSTTKAASVSYNGSDYVVNFDADNSLTFKATGAFALIKGNDTYSYTSNSIAKNNATEHGITLGSSYYTSKTFNGASDANSAYVSIDASDVDHAIRVTGNGNDNYMVASSLGGGTLLGGNGDDTLVAATGSTASLTLNGGEGSDSLVGGSGYNLFVYNGGVDSISGYQNEKDLASVASGFNPSTVAFAADDNNISLTFGDQDKLIFEGGASSTISLKSGSHTYAYSKDRIALDRSVTLTAGYSAASFAGGDAYDNINAEAVTVANGISITGNNNGNYIIGSASYANSFTGGTGDDTFRGGSAADIFFYTSGKDVIQNFGATDKLSITESDIDKARVSGTRLTFTMTDKKNTLTFRSDDAAPTSVSLQSGGYLTKDGVVKDTAKSLKLFSSAKGRIDYGAGIESINASAVDKQSVTLVGGSQGGSFTFAGTNKKRDGFEYNGGAVSISGYESGKDRINLGDYSISGFTVDDDKVAISLGNGTATGAVSLIGAKGSEVMIHQPTNKGNSYSKMVFAETGVVYDKLKATSATLSAGAGGDAKLYSATDVDSVKKIKVSSGVSAISIQAGNKNNTAIDASEADGVTLVSGDKNDKFTGSATNADTFIYTKGKDIIQNFVDTGAIDQISLGSGLETSTAKITSGSKSIKFKFGGSKDVLTIKATRGDKLSGTLTIDGKERAYGKNSIAENGNVSLTSEFGGTYNVSKSGGSTIDGSLVSKKLTFKGTDAAESILGGSGKTMFKGGGGNDTLQGGTGADTFFYAKGDKGSVTIADFNFEKDKLKIAGGTLAKVSMTGSDVQFAMKEGKGDSPEVGWFNVTTDAKDVLIKANNTYYWFADGNETLASDDTLTANEGALVTSVNKISSSQTKGYDIIELNYSTNLVRSNVAVQVKDTLKSNG